MDPGCSAARTGPALQTPALSLLLLCFKKNQQRFSRSRHMKTASLQRDNRVHQVVWLSACTMILFSPLDRAQEAESQSLEFSGSLALGAEHNDNLSVPELETSSGRSDIAATVEAELGMNWQPAERWTLDTGYTFSSNRYRDIDTFDLDLHLLYADVSYEGSLLTVGGNYYFATADLGGEGFLELNQYSAYAGKLLAENWYVRGAWNFIDKDFDTFTGRNADTTGPAVDIFRFFNEGRSNIALSLGRDKEDTAAPEFEYSANKIRLRASHRFSFLGRDTRAQLGYRLQDRDYDNITPSINAPRDDKQRVLEASLEWSMTGNFALLGSFEHGDYSSRLPSADYDETRIGLAAKLSF